MSFGLDSRHSIRQFHLSLLLSPYRFKWRYERHMNESMSQYRKQSKSQPAVIPLSMAQKLSSEKWQHAKV